MHRRKQLVWVRWCLDETSSRVKGLRYSFDRAVVNTGQTIDDLLTEHRDARAAKRFLIKGIRCSGVPEKITRDGSKACATAIRNDTQKHDTTSVILQGNDLNAHQLHAKICDTTHKKHQGVSGFLDPMTSTPRIS